jgi:hypothetical protein
MYTVAGGLLMRGGPIRATTGPVYTAPVHATPRIAESLR